MRVNGEGRKGIDFYRRHRRSSFYTRRSPLPTNLKCLRHQTRKQVPKNGRYRRTHVNHNTCKQKVSRMFLKYLHLFYRSACCRLTNVYGRLFESYVSSLFVNVSETTQIERNREFNCIGLE